LVINDSVNIVDMLESVIKFFRHESCGKCVPCRNGNEQLYKSVRKIKAGYAGEDELDKMLLIADTMQKTSFCALGQSLLLPVKSALDMFKDDFLSYINKKKAINK